MAFGKSIRLYLKDGTVTGIKIGEVVNQTIQAVSCPRTRIAELNQQPESKRPGVYFLFGQDESSNDLKAYIGEAENVFDRIQNHVANKDFWNEIIFFVSKDENLTKAHVKYLESRLVQIANSAKRYLIENSNQPQPPALPVADRDAMEEFLIYIRLLIGVLGHKLLENVISNEIKKAKSIEVNTSTELEQQVGASNNNTIELFFSPSGLKAKAIQTDEGIVVLAGSEAAKEHTTAPFSYKDLREKLINSNVLELAGDKYIFTTEYLFDTPSPAAAVIVGYNINGRTAWKNKTGKSLKEIEAEKLSFK